METRPGPWIATLRRSHEVLSHVTESLDEAALESPSYDSQWSVAQVFSHLGSQGEIFGLFLDAGLAGSNPPGPEAFSPIWDAWNSRSPASLASDCLEVNGELVGRFESLSPSELEQFHLDLFGMQVDAADLVRMRLSEYALHTWDIAVTRDPAATVAGDVVDLLVDGLDQLVARAGKADGTSRRIRIVTTAPDRVFILDIGDAVALAPGGDDDEGDLPELRLPAEGFIRLAYGRLDPDHMTAVETSDVELDDLRRIFPGI